MTTDDIKICMIAAVAENNVIGNGLDLPWHIKEDWKYFKTKTLGKPVIMGRKCFDSLNGTPLPKRPNIIITRNTDFQAYGATVVHSFDEAIELGKKLAADLGVDEVMLAGGTAIYEDGLKIADRLYINEVHMKPDGDVFFPDFDRNQWTEVLREPGIYTEGDSAKYTVTVLERKTD